MYVDDDHFKGYLAGLADSDLFGSLAIACLIGLLCGLNPRLWHMAWLRVLILGCLATVVALHVVGTYYMNTRVA
ncbi:hypothetical protein GCM10009504_01850 [Pseudomonas laurentiana]|uniref:Uncharacterized protein n=2 Tax=Pseudomonas laurentiana TaxID=2364649 RepID=A0A6I5RLW7_9PSED|nr:hypothetical protein [Pseudomonas laurentiana]NES08689.1 hypothetical protein [Pseudomonas laurentiana]GGU49034.1 hypothetical protein GCM10009504_01850 [Pseudomonas laurentiana]